MKAKEAGSEMKGNGSPEASKIARTLNSSFDGDKKSLISTLENSHFSSKRRASRRYDHIHKKQNFMPPSY